MLFKRELKRNFRAFAVTTLISSFLVIYIISMAPTFGTDIQQILDMKMPKELQNAIGMKGLDYSSASSFYAIAFSYVYLFLGIYVAGAFAAVVSKEFSDKTAEYLFSLPAKRSRIIITKLMVTGLYALGSVLIIYIASLVSFAAFIEQDYSRTAIALIALAWLMGSLFFGALAFFISSLTAQSKSASLVSIGVVVAMYLLQVIISMNGDISFLKYISPFDWFKGSDIIRYVSLDLKYSLVCLAMSALLIWGGIRRFVKMDVLV